MSERKKWSDLPDPETELALTIGAPAPDSEIEFLYHLTQVHTGEPVTTEIVVNQTAMIRGYEDIVIEVAGEARLNPSLEQFGARVIKQMRERRAAARRRSHLVAFFEEMPRETFDLVARVAHEFIGAIHEVQASDRQQAEER